MGREAAAPSREDVDRAIVRMSNDIHEIRNLIFVLILVSVVIFFIATIAAANG
jgi:hypothetical protein